MSTQPVAPHALTVAEYLELGEIESGYSELVEGRLIIHKRSDYTDAGIPHYRIVDITEPVSVLACHQAGDFGYVDGGVVTGTFTATAPVAVTIDLDGLLP
ncbi:hypothetical protein [Pseudonocardia sp. GCM10023141]|uniref:hypothetical protein n=1 Tax=Pseudonocardia sp. GCM10023141 TaxID=3252653 RepID=UPI0036080181